VDFPAGFRVYVTRRKYNISGTTLHSHIEVPISHQPIESVTTVLEESQKLPCALVWYSLYSSLAKRRHLDRILLVFGVMCPPEHAWLDWVSFA
jgi:hypothetical protein